MSKDFSLASEVQAKTFILPVGADNAIKISPGGGRSYIYVQCGEVAGVRRFSFSDRPDANNCFYGNPGSVLAFSHTMPQGTDGVVLVMTTQAPLWAWSDSIAGLKVTVIEW